MTPETRIHELERQLTETRQTAAEMLLDLAVSMAPDDLPSLQRCFRQWAEHPESSPVSARIAALTAGALDDEIRDGPDSDAADANACRTNAIWMANVMRSVRAG